MGILIGLLLPLIPTLVQHVERIIAGPKKGDERMSTVIGMIQALIAKWIANDGKGVAGLTDEQLRALIESIFQRLKSDGKLVPGTGPVLGDGWYLIRGSIQEVTIR